MIYTVRTDPSHGAKVADAAILDWAPGSATATVDCGTGFFDGWRPTRQAADLLVLAAAVYCADKTSPRSAAADAWTRDLTLSFPAADPARLDTDLLGRALGFLTGDRWNLAAYAEPVDPLATLEPLPAALLPAVDVDAVSLFSGGLDSLCGVIDLLEQDSSLRLGLVAHYDGGKATSKQEKLHARLAAEYGPGRVVLRRAQPQPAQHDPARPVLGGETSVQFLLLRRGLAAVVVRNQPQAQRAVLFEQVDHAAQRVEAAREQRHRVDIDGRQERGGQRLKRREGVDGLGVRRQVPPVTGEEPEGPPQQVGVQPGGVGGRERQRQVARPRISGRAARRRLVGAVDGGGEDEQVGSLTCRTPPVEEAGAAVDRRSG